MPSLIDNDVLSPTAAATLRAAVDRVVPPDAESPGGVDAGALDYLLGQLGPDGDLHRFLPDYRHGLDALNTLARERGAALADLPTDVQDAVLSELAKQEPRFFAAFVEHVQEGFYTSPAGMRMIGWEVTG